MRYDLLFIDSSEENEQLLCQRLFALKELGFEIEFTYVNNIAKAISLLKTRSMHIIIFTLSSNYSPQTPIIKEFLLQLGTAALIIQGSLEQQNSCLEWMEGGAQDFFSLKEISQSSLMQLVTYSLARQKYLNQLHALSLTDELTQCYNRRGFDLLLTKQIGIATRMKRGFILFYIDLDNLKKINDQFGHLVGDVALKDTAAILHECFRIYDIIGRIGGDEFTICVIDSKTEHRLLLEEKMQKNIIAYRNAHKRPFTLSLSIGSSIFDPTCPTTMEQLYQQADQSLYQSKRALRALR